jgi:hypothetical protein
MLILPLLVIKQLGVHIIFARIVAMIWPNLWRAVKGGFNNLVNVRGQLESPFGKHVN